MTEIAYLQILGKHDILKIFPENLCLSIWIIT